LAALVWFFVFGEKENMKFLQIAALAAACLFGGITMAADTVHEFKMKSIDGKEVNLSEYKGKVLLVVNVASKCGLTRQYDGLQSLYEKYSEKGVVVIGIPCNQFGGQEPGTEAEIKQFCTSKYDVTFPMMSKVDVNGAKQDPLYSFLKSTSPKTDDISWNFEKFVIGKDGKVAARFAPRTDPSDPALIEAIEAALKK
jgi:glutathione peroxidase